MKEYYTKKSTKYWYFAGAFIFIVILISILDLFLTFNLSCVVFIASLLGFELSSEITRIVRNPLVTVNDDFIVLPSGKVYLWKNIRHITLQQAFLISRCYKCNYEKNGEMQEFKIYLNGIEEEFLTYMVEKAKELNIPYLDKSKK